MTLADYAREKKWERYNVIDSDGKEHRRLTDEVAHVVAELRHLSVLRLKNGHTVQVQPLLTLR